MVNGELSYKIALAVFNQKGIITDQLTTGADNRGGKVIDCWYLLLIPSIILRTGLVERNMAGHL